MNIGPTRGRWRSLKASGVACRGLRKQLTTVSSIWDGIVQRILRLMSAVRPRPHSAPPQRPLLGHGTAVQGSDRGKEVVNRQCLPPRHTSNIYRVTHQARPKQNFVLKSTVGCNYLMGHSVFLVQVSRVRDRLTALDFSNIDSPR